MKAIVLDISCDYFSSSHRTYFRLFVIGQSSLVAVRQFLTVISFTTRAGDDQVEGVSERGIFLSSPTPQYHSL